MAGKDQSPNPQDQTSKTLLVTGGAGFIGSNFIRYILQEHPDWTVINLDKLTYAGNLANLADIETNYGVSCGPHDSDLSPPDSRLTTPDSGPRYFFVKGDICDRELVDSLLSGDYFTSQDSAPTTYNLQPTAIINFAAESHVDRSILDASPFVETNIKGTQVLLDAARAHWGCSSDSGLPTDDSRRFIQVSTDEVYGSLEETGVFTEESPLLPNSPYAASKAAADLLCRAYHQTYDLPVIVTRCSNNYGPFQFPEKLIPLVITNALEGKEVPIYGDGLNIRDWIHVEDHCRALDLAIQEGKPGEIYNVGANNEKSNLELVKLILDIAEKPRSLTKFVADRPGHDYRYALDTSKIEQELGWKSAISLEQGIRKTVQWYMQDQPWWQRIKSGEYVEYYQRMYLQR